MNINLMTPMASSGAKNLNQAKGSSKGDFLALIGEILNETQPNQNINQSIMPAFKLFATAKSTKDEPSSVNTFSADDTEVNLPSETAETGTELPKKDKQNEIDGSILLQMFQQIPLQPVGFDAEKIITNGNPIPNEETEAVSPVNLSENSLNIPPGQTDFNQQDVQNILLNSQIPSFIGSLPQTVGEPEVNQSDSLYKSNEEPKVNRFISLHNNINNTVVNQTAGLQSNIKEPSVNRFTGRQNNTEDTAENQVVSLQSNIKEPTVNRFDGPQSNTEDTAATQTVSLQSNIKEPTINRFDGPQSNTEDTAATQTVCLQSNIKELKANRFVNSQSSNNKLQPSDGNPYLQKSFIKPTAAVTQTNAAYSNKTGTQNNFTNKIETGKLEKNQSGFLNILKSQTVESKASDIKSKADQNLQYRKTEHTNIMQNTADNSTQITDSAVISSNIISASINTALHEQTKSSLMSNVIEDKLQSKIQTKKVPAVESGSIKASDSMRISDKTPALFETDDKAKDKKDKDSSQSSSDNTADKNSVFSINAVQTEKVNLEKATYNGKVDRQSVLQQTASVTAEAAKTGRSEFRIHLSPEQLGGITIKMVSQNGSISIKIAADNSDTSQLLAGGVQDLNKALTEQGIMSAKTEIITTGSFGFDFGGQSNRQYSENQNYTVPQWTLGNTNEASSDDTAQISLSKLSIFA